MAKASTPDDARLSTRHLSVKINTWISYPTLEDEPFLNSHLGWGIVYWSQVTQPQAFSLYAPLNARLTEVLVVAEEKGILNPPRPMKENPKMQKFDKYFLAPPR